MNRQDGPLEVGGVDDTTGRPRPLLIENATGALKTTGGGGGGGNVTIVDPIGQQAMADSVAVVIASDQSAVPVSAASLPLPTGASTLAEQQTQTTALQIIDKWDESDRAKVNPIVGQAGVQGASGTVSANTQRVVLATDVALPAGTNNIGDVDVLSLPATPAGTNLIGRVSASDETSTIYNGTTALTPKFAIIQEASSGNNAVVAAVTSKKIRVLAYNFIANGTVNAKFQSDGAGTPTDLTGLKYCVANMGISASYNPVGWFETGSGLSLDLNLSAAVAVGGELVYVEV